MENVFQFTIHYSQFTILNEPIPLKYPDYHPEMRQWRQMRQMRHFFCGHVFSYLGGQPRVPVPKNRKSVAFCHTGGGGCSAGHVRCAQSELCARHLPVSTFFSPLPLGREGERSEPGEGSVRPAKVLALVLCAVILCRMYVHWSEGVIKKKVSGRDKEKRAGHDAARVRLLGGSGGHGSEVRSGRQPCGD